MPDPISTTGSSSGKENLTHDPGIITRSGQSLFMSVYRTEMANQSCLITITWCKNLLLHGLSISIQGLEPENQYTCKVDLKPWYFWRKQGSKHFTLTENRSFDIYWDLKNAKFNGETEPSSDFYVAVVHKQEIVLLLGDLKTDVYRKTGCRPALTDPTLVSRTEHVSGKKKFSTRVKFDEKQKVHEISIECKNRNSKLNKNEDCLNETEPEMEIRIDGDLLIHVKHLQWKFRGNESVIVDKKRVEVYWDVHDWLFSPGLRHALFTFKPSGLSSSVSLPTTSSSSLSSSSSSFSVSKSFSGCSVDGLTENWSSEFRFFLYAWKFE